MYGFLLFNLLLLIIIPIVYCIIIPAMVQNTLNTLGLNSGSYPVLLQNVNLGEFTASALDLDIGLSIPPVVPLPIRAGLGRTQIYVTDQVNFSRIL